MKTLVLPSIAVSLAVMGCEPEADRCDADQRYSYGLCYTIDAPLPTVDAPPVSFEHFGDICTGDPSCMAPTNFCAKYPSDPTGYCTRTGCLTDMSICPAGWGCLDLSAYGLAAICLKP